ncbi:MAG: IS200/IS605 family transposase [Acidobacteria bacterium]|jgi:REP element-mobilizing transposase RayT|nr:IS200/IS605 family transposase [Acidobacteriota bacterium]
MSDAFSNLSVHLVFSTKERIPLMTQVVRNQLFPYVGGIVKGLGGTIIAVGGMPDHVHVLARVPPKLCVADLVRTIKANSSKMMNEKATAMKFGWQRGYGAFSVSQSAVSSVAQYVRNQERHHRRRSFEEELKILLTKHGMDVKERYLG